MSAGAPTIGGLERLEDYLAGQRKWEVDISGGEIANVALSNVTIDGIDFATSLSVAEGGTGADNASDARTNLGLAIGADIQAYDAGLQSISGLTTAADKGIYTTALDTYATYDFTAFARTLLDDANQAAMQTTLGLVPGTNVQAYDAGLQSIAGLTTGADLMIYTTASDVYATTALTSFARTLLDDTTNTAARTTLDAVGLSNNETITGNKTFSGTATFSNASGVTTDTITERTAAAGVTVDGVTLKDTTVLADSYKEKTAGFGVVAEQETPNLPVLTSKTTVGGIAVDMPIWQSRTTTTDGTVSSLQAIPTVSDHAYLLTTRVVARRTGGSAGTAGDMAAYVICGAFRNIGGVVTQVGTTTTLFTAESQAGWNLTYDISGTFIRVRCTGATNNNVSWEAHTTFVDIQS